MTHYFFRIKSFIAYWLEAVDEHSLHSPFFFDLYTRHIKTRTAAANAAQIETLRKKLLEDNRLITVQDLGSGSTRATVRKVARIARTSLSPPRYSNIYSRLISAFQARTIVELGTSLGINTLYLAQAPGSSVATFEGAPAIAEIAAITFEFGQTNNIELITGDINTALPGYLQRVRHVDFALIDANHKYAPTVRYFEWLLKKTHNESIVVVDDIHSSAEMERAWKTIRQHRLVYGSADLYRCGILFFDPSLNKQHVILQV